MSENFQITKNEPANRFELHHGQERIGLIDYRQAADGVEMYHTEVDPSFGGQGLGQRLVEFALADALEQGYAVVPTCPYIAKIIDRDDRYQGLRA